MRTIYRFIIVLILLLSMDGCGNGGGGDNEVILQLSKVTPLEKSVEAGHELKIAFTIDSNRDISAVPISFTAISLKVDGNKTTIKEQSELGGAGVDIVDGIKDYNITLIVPSDIKSDEFNILAHIDPLNSIESISDEELYFESEDTVEIIDNSIPDVKLLKIDIDSNETDINVTSGSNFIDYGLINTFSGDRLLVINDKNITISGLLSLLPLVKDMNNTKITACIKLNEEECVPFTFIESDESNHTIFKSEKEVDLTINNEEDISFELFMDRATLLAIAKKVFKISKSDILSLDIEFMVKNDDFGFEKTFTRGFNIKSNNLSEEVIDNSYDPISVLSEYYSEPVIFGTVDGEPFVPDNLIVLDKESLSDDYKALMNNKKKPSGINKKLFSKKLSKGKWGKLFGAGISFKGSGLLDIDGVTAKVSGKTKIRVLRKHGTFTFLGVDSIVKLNPSSFQETGYSMTLKFGKFNIFTLNSDLSEATGMGSSTSKDKKIRIKENNRTINMKYTQDRQRSLVSFEEDRYFGKSQGYAQTIFLGWVPVNFESGVGGKIGIKGSIGLDGITNLGSAITPYIALTADLSASVGIRGIAEFGAKGEFSMIENGFVASTSGKLELVGNETEIYRFDGTLEERIDNVFLGPKGRLYGFVKYPAKKYCTQTSLGQTVKYACGLYIKTLTKDVAKFRTTRHSNNLLRKKQTLFKVKL